MGKQLVFLAGLFFLVACSNDGKRFGPKPKALGSANQITVICDEALWKGDLGDSLSQYFESVYPVLPRPEPLFDLRHFSPFQIQVENLRRELRTYLLCATTNDTASSGFQLAVQHLGDDIAAVNKATLKMVRDRWATDQIILYLVAPDEASLVRSISQYFPAITEQVKAHDDKQIKAKTYLSGTSAPLSRKLKSKYQLGIAVPSDYQLAQEEDDFLWLRKDFEDITMNLLFYAIPYRDTSQFSPQAIKTLRDSLGRKYVSSTSDGSYMVTNDRDLPMIASRTKIGGHYAVELRGIWEMARDFMGGPFLSYLVHDESSGRLIFMDGFILAPGRSKRELMQEFEIIFRSKSDQSL